MDEGGTRGTAIGLRGSGDEWMRGPFAQECIDGVTLHFHYVGTRFHLVRTQFHFVRIDFHVASTQIHIGCIDLEDGRREGLGEGWGGEAQEERQSGWGEAVKCGRKRQCAQ